MLTQSQKCKGCDVDGPSRPGSVPACYFFYEDIIGDDCHDPDCRHPRSQHFRMGIEYAKALSDCLPGQHVTRIVPGANFTLRVLKIPSPHSARIYDPCPPPTQSTHNQRKQFTKFMQAPCLDTKHDVLAAALKKRRCHKCGKIDSDGVKLHVCARCMTAFYCTKGCQRLDWPAHKLSCRLIPK